MKRKYLVIILSVILIVATLPTVVYGKTPNITAKAAILIDSVSGEVLFKKNEDLKLPPASITKVMTLILAGEALKDGKVSLDDIVTVSQNARKMGGSQVYLEVGEQMSLEDILKAVAIFSANDATVALAEHISGSEEKFVERMNEKAKELGMTNTYFMNPTGLDQDGHLTTAKDIAIMSREILKHQDIMNYLTIWQDWLRKDDEKRKFWLTNRNRLIRDYPGCDGIKTGFTNEALHCLTATAQKGDFRLIAVVLGAQTSNIRYDEVASLLDYGFNNFSSKQYYKKGDIIESQVLVNKGGLERIDVIVGDNVNILFKKGEEFEPEQIINISTLEAPLDKNKPVGEIVFMKDGQIISKTHLYPAKDVPKATYLNILSRILQKWTKILSK